MNNSGLLLITLEGREYIVNNFPFSFRKSKNKEYFRLIKESSKGKLERYRIESIPPYTTKIVDQNLMEKEFPENFDKILLIKNKKNIPNQNNFGDKINVQNDNVINTINFIDMSQFSEKYKHLISYEKNVMSMENKYSEASNKFYPKILYEPILKNPEKIKNFDRILINQWTFEERELLKKSLLSFGYGRWNKIRKSFFQRELFGNYKKSISEVRAYSNSLIKSIADNLNFQNLELRNLLLYILEQPKEIPQTLPENSVEEEVLGMENKNEKKKLNKKLQDYIFMQNYLRSVSEIEQNNEKFRLDHVICVNSRDWDLNSIRQRAKPWAKRLLIMYRINTFMNNYKKHFLQITGRKCKNFFDFTTILSFIDTNLLSGQKPCPWWSNLHDIHLIYSTFYNGYANYFAAFLRKNPKTTILPNYFYPYLAKTDSNQNECRKLFYLDQKVNLYSEILLIELPNADAITRRLKKLVSIIHKYSTDSNQKSEITPTNKFLDNILPEDKPVIIDFIKSFGLPITNKNKINYPELLDKLPLSGVVNIKDLEKFIHILQLISFCVYFDYNEENFIFNSDIHDPKLKELVELFDVNLAEEFLRNINMIHFVRQKIIGQDFLIKFFNEYQSQIIPFLETKNKEFYDINVILKNLKLEVYSEIFYFINSNGLMNMNLLQEKLGIKNLYTLMNMVFLFIEFIRPFIESNNSSMNKKRKMEYMNKPNNEDIKNQSFNNNDDV
jgi:hypothetical protein